MGVVTCPPSSAGGYLFLRSERVFAWYDLPDQNFGAREDEAGLREKRDDMVLNAVSSNMNDHQGKKKTGLRDGKR